MWGEVVFLLHEVVLFFYFFYLDKLINDKNELEFSWDKLLNDKNEFLVL